MSEKEILCEIEALPSRKAAANKSFAIFKHNPFEPRFRPHKIQRPSAKYGLATYAAWIVGKLRAAFFVEAHAVWSVDVGTHAIYRP